MGAKQEIDSKVDAIRILMTEVRILKEEHPEHSCIMRSEPGSVLNAYREGDITFEHAKDMIENMACSEKVKQALDMEGITKMVVDMYKARSRSEIWDALYETEYESDSLELNDVMVCMTDAEVADWFPKIFTEYMLKQLNLL